MIAIGRKRAYSQNCRMTRNVSLWRDSVPSVRSAIRVAMGWSADFEEAVRGAWSARLGLFDDNFLSDIVEILCSVGVASCAATTEAPHWAYPKRKRRNAGRSWRIHRALPSDWDVAGDAPRRAACAAFPRTPCSPRPRPCVPGSAACWNFRASLAADRAWRATQRCQPVADVVSVQRFDFPGQTFDRLRLRKNEADQRFRVERIKRLVIHSQLESTCDSAVKLLSDANCCPILTLPGNCSHPV